MAQVDRDLNERIAKMRGVRAAITLNANQLEQNAKTIRAQHFVTGQLKVTHTRGTLDHFVNLEDPNVLSIEYGHFTRGGGRFVRGLHILTRAMGAMF